MAGAREGGGGDGVYAGKHAGPDAGSDAARPADPRSRHDSPTRANGRTDADPWGRTGGAPAAPGGGLPGANPPGAGKGKKATERLEVHGRILTNRAGKMTVDASAQHSKRKVFVELAPDAKIAVDVNDYSRARAGDAIEVIGNPLARDGSTIEALEVRIDLAAPLTGPRKGRHPAVAKRPAEKPGEEMARSPTETAPPGTAADSPAGKPDKAQQLVQFLQLPPAEMVGKQGMKVSSKDGTNLEFTPCRPEPTKDIIDKFGQPDHIAIPHLFNEGPDGQKTQLAWQLWFYGNVMFFVDETGAARYYSLVPKAEKQPEKKPEKKE